MNCECHRLPKAFNLERLPNRLRRRIEEGGYIVTCLSLPGLVTEGDNLREARRMAREAITGYIEVLIKHGQPVPEDSRIRAEQIGIDVLAAA